MAGGGTQDGLFKFLQETRKFPSRKLENLKMAGKIIFDKKWQS